MANVPKASIKYSVNVRTLPPDFFSAFKKGAQLEAKKSIEKLANDTLIEAQEIIKGQKYKWSPLAESTSRHKTRYGLDPRIMIATRDYLENGIKVTKKGKHIFVGPVPNKKHKGSKVKYTDIAKWLEYGTKKMPARPLWRPLKSSVKRRSKVLRKAYATAMKKQLEDAKNKKMKKTSKKG